ncbi:MAG: BON domain-containing protein [Thiobacillaceae bacterium]
MRKLLVVTLLGLTATAPLTGCLPVVATGVGVGAMMADDRRLAGVYIEDEEIEWRAGSRLREAKLDGVRANFTSFNRRLLITGEAPTEALKARVSEIGRGVPGVKDVYNEMAIAGPIGFAARSNDGYLTTKVKARLFDDSRINANHVKVVTSNSVVYLMGLVKREEAEIAAGIAARTSGVQRVVKVFEYLD